MSLAMSNLPVIAMERSLRAEIEEFHRSDLQHVEAAVKIHLPSAESKLWYTNVLWSVLTGGLHIHVVIAQEKQQQKQQQQRQEEQGSSVDQFEDAESSSSEPDDIRKY